MWAVENDLQVPADFETSRKRCLREAREEAANDQRFRTLQLKNQYDTWAGLQISEYLDRNYAAERLETALREQLKTIRREQPDWFARVPDATRRELAKSRLRAAIRDSLNLPSFESWVTQNTQEQLF